MRVEECKCEEKPEEKIKIKPGDIIESQDGFGLAIILVSHDVEPNNDYKLILLSYPKERVPRKYHVSNRIVNERLNRGTARFLDCIKLSRT